MNNEGNNHDQRDNREDRARTRDERAVRAELEELREQNTALQGQVTGLKRKEREWENDRKELTKLRKDAEQWAKEKEHLTKEKVDLTEGLEIREAKNKQLMKELNELKLCLDKEEVKKFLDCQPLIDMLATDIVTALEDSGYNKTDPMSNPPDLANYTNANFIAGLGNSVLVKLLRDIIVRGNEIQNPSSSMSSTTSNEATDPNRAQFIEQWHTTTLASILQGIDPNFKWQLAILYSLEIRKRTQSATLIDLAPVAGTYSSDALRTKKKQYVKKVLSYFVSGNQTLTI